MQQALIELKRRTAMCLQKSQLVNQKLAYKVICLESKVKEMEAELCEADRSVIMGEGL